MFLFWKLFKKKKKKNKKRFCALIGPHWAEVTSVDESLLNPSDDAASSCDVSVRQQQNRSDLFYLLRVLSLRPDAWWEQAAGVSLSVHDLFYYSISSFSLFPPLSASIRLHVTQQSASTSQSADSRTLNTNINFTSY